jgi:hypothetical protein
VRCPFNDISDLVYFGFFQRFRVKDFVRFQELRQHSRCYKRISNSILTLDNLRQLQLLSLERLKVNQYSKGMGKAD